MVLGYPCYIFYRIHATMFAEKFIGLAAIEENINNFRYQCLHMNRIDVFTFCPKLAPLKIHV